MDIYVSIVGEKYFQIMCIVHCKDRWTKMGGELGLFQISKTIKATLTYAMLVRLNSPTG